MSIIFPFLKITVPKYFGVFLPFWDPVHGRMCLMHYVSSIMLSFVAQWQTQRDTYMSFVIENATRVATVFSHHALDSTYLSLQGNTLQITTRERNVNGCDQSETLNRLKLKFSILCIQIDTRLLRQEIQHYVWQYETHTVLEFCDCDGNILAQVPALCSKYKHVSFFNPLRMFLEKL